MIDDLKIQELLSSYFQNRNDLFSIETKVYGNKITVVLDGDNGLKIKDCGDVTRFLIENLENSDDFNIEVSSAGADSSIVNPRQYNKLLGKKIEITTTEKTFEGTLTEINEQNVSLEWKERVPKTIGKGKMTVTENKTFDIKQIIKAKAILKF